MGRSRLADGTPAAPWRSLAAAIARQAVVAAARREPYAVPRAWLTGRLAEPGASFVTLRAGGELRGCIGSLTARRPLAMDVAENGRAAALADRRFPPLEARELGRLEIELSQLTPPEPIPADSRSALLEALVPGVDGLVLEEGACRATFLPAVWSHLPDPDAFVGHLERKAGVAAGSWSPARRLSRYRTESIVVGPALGGSTDG